MFNKISSRIVALAMMSIVSAGIAAATLMYLSNQRVHLVAALRSETEAARLMADMSTTSNRILNLAALRVELSNDQRRDAFNIEVSALKTMVGDLADLVEDAEGAEGLAGQVDGSIQSLESAFETLMTNKEATEAAHQTLVETVLPEILQAHHALKTQAFNSKSQELIANVSDLERLALRVQIALSDYLVTGQADQAALLDDAAKSLSEGARRARSTFRSDGRDEAKQLFKAVRSLEPGLEPLMAARGDLELQSLEMQNTQIPSIAADLKLLRDTVDATAEAMSHQSETAATQSSGRAFALVIATATLILVISLFEARHLSRKFRSLRTSMTALAEGDLDTDLPNPKGQSEFAQMSRALEIFRDNALQREEAEKEAKKMRHEQAQMAEDQAKAAQKDAALDEKLRNTVEQLVTDVIAGRLSSRIEDDFGTGARAELASRINKLVSVIDHSLTQTRNFAKSISNGDLDARVQGDFNGQFADMQHDLNNAIDRLSGVFCVISEVSEHVSESSADMRASANELSERTSAQVKKLGFTSEVMKDILLRIEESNQATREIQNITNLVRDIAHQTNLLALNASVEAARAGDAGKGFAVVAGEVRILSQRTNQAAEDIKKLIDAAEHSPYRQFPASKKRPPVKTSATGSMAS